MVSFRWLCEVWEPTIIPVEVTRVNNNTANCGTVATTKLRMSATFLLLCMKARGMAFSRNLPYPFGSGVHNNISPMFDGTNKVTTNTKCTIDKDKLISCNLFIPTTSLCGLLVYNERNTGIMSNFCDSLDIWYSISWISDTLNVHSLGLVVNKLFKLCGVV